MSKNEQFELPLAHYDDGGVNVELRLEPGSQDGVWATQDQMADVFGVTKKTISEHLQNIFSSGELEEITVVRKFRTTAADGKSYDTKHYNLAAIISVGFRVSGPRATRFRQWANKVLREYATQGYVINEDVLRNNPSKLDDLASRVRALRSEERSVYFKVKECFKISASDYSPNSQEVRSFYALVQDKFHHAITKMTASKLVMDRADHSLENMGMQSFPGIKPKKADAKVGKNYLTKEELYRMHLLSEQFLLFAESTALSGKKMTIRSLKEQLDKLLTLNDYDVFDGYQDYLKHQADKHIEIEWKAYKARLKLEKLGIEYDTEAHALGEYDEILGKE
ncbi:RhuM family protein [Bombella apis]|uniref:RhuM family protein n=1 Tax=Bombella apis TaxID=1785988 RepID=UPI0012B9194A|nr:RhuM family protein [Bombella apis]MPV99843.1 hypothetical protein [Bombella apis]